MRFTKIQTLIAISIFLPSVLKAQKLLNTGQVHGSFQMDAQYYIEDSLIGAPKVPENVLMNAYANLLYTNGDFTAGLRYESYQNVLQGFDQRNKGNGIPYRFASYKSDDFQFTIGNIYDQFGNGLVFRTYQDWNLGIDNSLDGLRVIYTPSSGINLKGLIGNQRFFFEKGPGIIRGFDGEFALNELFSKWREKKTKINLGGSFISKYQKDLDPLYNLPENVGAFASRFNMASGKFNVSGEYAHKINDPSYINKYIYRPGEALYISASYSQKGLGASITAKRIDNMSFYSDRNETGNTLMINYLPSFTKQHIYTLATMYPCITMLNGEMGIQSEIIYNIKKNSFLGGKYGAEIMINYSRVNAIDKTKINDTTDIQESGTLGYNSRFLKPGKDVYFEDFNIEYTKRLSAKWKAILTYAYQTYNTEVLEGHPGAPIVYAHIGVLDLTYKINDQKSLQFDLQHLLTQQDYKNWLSASAELTIAPKWFFSIADQWNYGNTIEDLRIHYYTASVGYIKNTNRISLAYGKQQEGFICVGGVCRYVPASNGLTLTLISSF